MMLAPLAHWSRVGPCDSSKGIGRVVMRVVMRVAGRSNVTPCSRATAVPRIACRTRPAQELP